MEEDQDKKPEPKVGNNNTKSSGESVVDKVFDKIEEAESVLVALSSDPSVDEIAAAMALSMVLDSIGKHATAIYSGKTPNVLEFLNPSERFETNTDSLQDFIIALNKDKADHLRYKIDGDFVKVYVTPYKTTISGDDLEFSRGDFNVDLVISLNVPAATELDAALREHGRIMHDATSINITNGAAGKFGDLEWVDPQASSISEMVAKLAFELSDKMDEATATALLTGLVSATDRFSNPATTPDVMALAAKLMSAGADQQLVVQNVQGEVKFDEEPKSKDDDEGKLDLGNDEEDEESSVESEAEPEEKVPEDDGTSLNISHGDKEEKPEEEAVPVEMPVGAPAEMPTGMSAEMPAAEPAEESAAVDAEIPQETEEPALPTEENPVQTMPEQENNNDAVASAMAEALNPAGTLNMPGPDGEPAEGGYPGGAVVDQILNGIEKGSSNVGSADYGKMIDDALNEPLPGEGGIQVGTNGPAGPQVDTQDVEKMEEEEALNTIHQAQAQAQAEMPTLPSLNGELPKIVPTGGSLGYESPSEQGIISSGEGTGSMGAGAQLNPAMAQTPEVASSETAGVPDMNFQAGGMGAAGAGQTDVNAEMNPMGMGNEGAMGVTPEPNPMPMPGQEIAPPPVLPAPDFGTMPPTDTPSVAPIENVVPVPEPVPTPDVTVMPDMNAPISAMNDANGVPQMPKVVNGQDVSDLPFGQSIMGNISNVNGGGDPSAFKIPGIHT